MLVTIILLTFVVDRNIVAYVWLSLVVTVVTVLGVNWGVVLAMTPLVFFYFYGLQSNFVVTVGLKLLYTLLLSVIGGTVGVVIGVLSSTIFLRLVEGGLVWLRIGGIYFLGLTYVRPLLAIGVVMLYIWNLSSLAVMTLVLRFPLTAIFFIKVGLVAKAGRVLVLVFIPILSFSMGYVGIVPPSYWGVGAVFTGVGGVVV